MCPIDGMIFRLEICLPFGETGFRAEHITENDVRRTLISITKERIKTKNKQMKKNKQLLNGDKNEHNVWQ